MRLHAMHSRSTRTPKNVPGSPPIFETTRRKIDAAAIFVPYLTFVVKRPNGDPCPNLNVLSEYGYALKSLTYHRVIGVMNAAFGEPSRESLPFDLASYHFPITYDLPEGASQDERRAALKKAADEFERALKGASLATNISRAYLSLYLCHTAIRSTGEPGLGKEGNLSASTTTRPDR